MKERKFPEIEIDKNGKNIKLTGKSLSVFNQAIRKKVFSVSPNGVIFYNNPKGVYAQMEKDIYLKRKELKRKKFQKLKEYEKTKDIKIKYEAQNLDTSQLAVKIMINGAYGVTAVPYSRYFSP